jgi:nucleoside-diphosphate-sugar epimerase
MKVLVTGAGGFIGKPAVLALQALGHEVHGVYRSRPNWNTPDIPHTADLFDDAQTSRLVENIRPNAILHAAWFVEHGRFWDAPENLDFLAATLRMARCAAAAGCSRFVGIGTCFEYALAGMARCHETNTPAVPETLYGIVKDATHRTLAAYFSQTQMSFSWARLFYIYGPREGRARLIPSLALKLLAGEPAPIGSGTHLRDYMHVADCGRSLAALTASPVMGTVNIGTGKGVTIVSIARRLAELSGRPELLRIGLLPDRPLDPPAIVSDAGRLQTEVGILPTTSLDEGLAETLNWWRAQGVSQKTSSFGIGTTN